MISCGSILVQISLRQRKKDFEPANRKKFCSRIATGDYDAVIIGHSQFEKIPVITGKTGRLQSKDRLMK